jgi:UDP-N-acetyl-D-mannosaminuronic acid dehydrogenase
VLGLGYIGLPTAAMLADAGHDVSGYDVDGALLGALRAKRISAEPEVAEIVSKALDSGRLHLVDALSPSDAFLICVPTPTHGHKPDLSYVEAATLAIAPLLRPGDAIILESTVPPGTVERVVAGAIRRCALEPNDFRIAHCPERVIPGAIVHELRTNARVIGGRKDGDAQYARELYASFATGPIHITDCTTAELVKVVENTFRDVNIAFANELALLCEELGVDVWDTIRLANEHPRVSILSPGPGVGGHCIPVDPHFLSNANPFVTELIQTARRINERMPDIIVRRIATRVPLEPRDANIALLGAAYKPNVDDTRESPTERIDELLRERGYNTRIFDPLARRFSRPLCSTLDEAVSECDAVVLITEHDIFRQIDPFAMRPLVRHPLFVSARPPFNLQSWREAGFLTYVLGAADDEPQQTLTRRPSDTLMTTAKT